MLNKTENNFIFNFDKKQNNDNEIYIIEESIYELSYFNVEQSCRKNIIIKAKSNDLAIHIANQKINEMSLDCKLTDVRLILVRQGWIKQIGKIDDKQKIAFCINKNGICDIDEYIYDKCPIGCSSCVALGWIYKKYYKKINKEEFDIL